MKKILHHLVFAGFMVFTTLNLLAHNEPDKFTQDTKAGKDEFAGGSGTASDPWLIETAEHLDNVRHYLGYDHSNKYFKQIAVINLNVEPWNEGEGWLPIGGPDFDDSFMGQYDGNGYYITGIIINRTDEDNVGLFGRTSIAKISNLGIVIPILFGNNNVGAFVGQAHSTTIENCFVVGGEISGSGDRIGGLAGKSLGRLSIRNSFNRAAKITGVSNVGGLVGRFSDAFLKNSYNTGAVEGDNLVGGVVGYAWAGNVDGIIKHCYSSGYIKGIEDVGGLVGKNIISYPVEISGSFWDTETSLQDESDGGIGKTTEEMKSFSTFIEAGWDFKNAGIEEIWNIGNDRNDGYPYHNWEYPDDPPPDEPYTPYVSTTGVKYFNRTHESAIVDVLVILTGNPDAQYGVCWNTTGMPNIEDDDSTNEGIITQAGHFTSEITGLDINQNYYVRAYAFNDEGIHYGEQISFVTLAMEPVIPEGSGEENAPYLIDSLNNLLWITINLSEWDKSFLQTSDIDASETILWDNGEGWMPIGSKNQPFRGFFNGGEHIIDGLYINRPDSLNQGFIGYCSYGEVSFLGLTNVQMTGGRAVGGIIGFMSTQSLIRQSYTTGTVNGSSNVGGLIGEYLLGGDYGGVINSYSTAEAEGDFSIGGLIGAFGYGNQVTNCYSAGAVSGNDYVGGLIGYISGGNHPNNSFWDTETSGQEQSAGGQGKSSLEMIIENTFSMWDFDEIWTIHENETYPFLQWQFFPGEHNYPKRFLLKLESSPEPGGTTIGEDKYVSGVNVTVEAIASEGYEFVNWTNLEDAVVSNQAEYTHIMPAENDTLIANFSMIDYTFSANTEPTDAGVVEISPEKDFYNIGDLINLTATPNENYKFQNWYKDGISISSQTNFTYTMPAENVTLTAQFVDENTELHTLTLDASPADGGSANGGGSFVYNETITISANAGEGFEFVNWTGDTDYIDNQESATTIVNMPDNDVNLTANFSLKDYIVVVDINPESSGSAGLEPDQDYYNMGDEITITATAGEGYDFVNWTGDTKHIDNPSSDTATLYMPADDVNLTANFNLKFYKLIIEDIYPENSGNVEIFPDLKYYNMGDEITLIATAGEGYEFDSWTGDTDYINNISDYTTTVVMPAGNVILAANFALIDYKLIVDIYPEEAGRCDFNPEQDYYNMDDEVNLTAVAEEGFKFVNWTDEQSHVVSNERSFDYIMPAKDVTLTANFDFIDYTLTLEVNPENSGYINVFPYENYYQIGDEITLTASGNQGFEFVNWTDYNNIVVNDQETFVYKMQPKDVVLKANFDFVESTGELAANGIKVFPNPASKIFTVESTELIKYIKLIDITGQVTKHLVVEDFQTKLNVNNLKTGIYFLQIHTGEAVITKRVQIAR